jgi:hypothetical protein
VSDSRPVWAQQWEAATKVLDDAGIIPGALHERVAALVTAAKEAAERLQAAEAESEDNDAAWQGARDRAARLQAERDSANRERAEMVRERDNCREVLRKEREERAAEKATTGQALASLRAEVNTLGETVEKMTEEREAVRALIAALPKCEHIVRSSTNWKNPDVTCGLPATKYDDPWGDTNGSAEPREYRCDEHGVMKHYDDLDYAEPLRKLQALLDPEEP